MGSSAASSQAVPLNCFCLNRGGVSGCRDLLIRRHKWEVLTSAEGEHSVCWAGFCDTAFVLLVSDFMSSLIKFSPKLANIKLKIQVLKENTYN